jgi:hypothetical protein
MIPKLFFGRDGDSILPFRLWLLGLTTFWCVCGASLGFCPSTTTFNLRRSPGRRQTVTDSSCRRSSIALVTKRSSILLSTYGDGEPSDYDTDDLGAPTRQVTVDRNAEDESIRESLKRELLLLSSVTNRGEYATLDEQNALVDLVTQLEALNPTENPASNAMGEWDLCLSSTQFFRSSPFFQSIRIAAGNSNRQIVENGFDLHDRATSSSRVGRVRQQVTSSELRSEVDLEVGFVPGIPLRLRGTVVTVASLRVLPPETWEVKITTTSVKSSNIPFINELLDDPKLVLPVGDFYSSVMGETPAVPFRTFYVDESLRITRDVDDNFFVFTRA